jgi:hypothetical protein
MSSEVPPSEAVTFRANIQAQIASLRDTAKWMAGGVAIAASGIVAGGALVGVGSLDAVPRVIVAVVGAAIGLASLGAVLSQALDVLAARRLPLSAFSDERIIRSGEREYLESVLADLFPPDPGVPGQRIQGFSALAERMDAIRRSYQSPDQEVKESAAREAKQLNGVLSILVPAATFEELRYRFLILKRRVLLGGLCLTLGLTAFVWAANPPKDPALLKKPSVVTIAVDKRDQAAIDKVWSSDTCRGRSSIEGLVVRRHDSGSDDVVTIPADKCQDSVRLEYRANRLFAPE